MYALCSNYITHFTSIFQILFRNNSYVKSQELIDYQTMRGNRVQMSIINKSELPLILKEQSQYIFDIVIKGK